MKKRIFAVIFFVVIAVLLVLPASASQTSTEEQTALEISRLINEYRAQNGLYQYVYNTTLEAVAQKHTEYQVSIQLSTHEGEGGSTSKDRITAGGYGGGEFIFADEIIYSGGYATPQAALEWWKNSSIHNSIMLSENYHEFGVGVRITEGMKYYTVNFASIKDVTSPGVGSMPIEPSAVDSAPVIVAAIEGEVNQPSSDLPVDTAAIPVTGIATSRDIQAAIPDGWVLIPNLLLTVLVVVVIISSAGVTFFAYLRMMESRRRKR